LIRRVYLLTSRANPEHWTCLLKLIGREDPIDDARYHPPDARLQRGAEVDEIVTGWTRQRTKHEDTPRTSRWWRMVRPAACPPFP
jgi:formyl-CoA transferase